MSLKKQQASEQWDKEISRLAKQLKRYVPPEELWDKIEARLPAEMDRSLQPAREKKHWLRWLTKTLRHFRTADARWNGWRIGFAAATVLFVISLSTLFIYQQWINIVPGETDILLAQIEGDIEQVERQYQQAIDQLTQLAKQNEKNVEPYLLALYQEKITLLDESIRECQRALAENHRHPVAQLALLQSYRQKVETLKLIIQAKSS
jgi:tetratricopeptide (TPR) repeat protein